MNNLHRELAPISAAAWEAIEEEAKRTLKRHLAARCVVDVEGPKGFDLSAVGTGHVRRIDPPTEGVEARQREALKVVEFRVPFELSREAIDDVERGAEDSDWDSLKAAAKTIAFAEDRAIIEGYGPAGIEGVGPAASNPPVTLPVDVADYPETVAKALAELRLAGVEGPYTLLLGADPYTTVFGGSEKGYPVLQHLQRLIDGGIIWAPAISGGLVVTTRGGDFKMSLGQDFSIGYLRHDDNTVKLYLQESFTFQMLTAEAAVALLAPVK
jgi:uncharacterized linocin/CFP29 family protein